jgi:hypothetical protein
MVLFSLDPSSLVHSIVFGKFGTQAGADQLAKRGLPHPVACPFSDQANEMIQHVPISCVFSRQSMDHDSS